MSEHNGISFTTWLTISQLLKRYVDSLEADDYETMGACFHADVELDFSDAYGPASPPVVGRNRAVNLIRRLRHAHETDARRHFTGEMLVVEHSPDRVLCTTPLMLVATPPDGEPQVRLTGEFRDVITREPDGRWVIAKRSVHRDR